MKLRKLAVFSALVFLLGVVTQGLAQAEIDSYEPITAEYRLEPADGDWPMWRRTYNAGGFSPLDQVNRDNVTDLELAWAWTMVDGRQETTPLVYDGVMFLHNQGDLVQALDAASGDLIWSYQRDLPGSLATSSASIARSMAL